MKEPPKTTNKHVDFKELQMMEFLDLEYKITIYKTLNKLKIKYKNMSKEQEFRVKIWKIRNK